MAEHPVRRPSQLRSSGEFRVVYASGRRYDGKFLTAFVRRSDLPNHRLGITASRKTSRSAVERNRVKRLLREAFRLCAAELDGLEAKYDWVLNARRSLLTVKVTAPLEEFKNIIARVAGDEGLNNASAEKLDL